jgi:hypothetical protein
MDELQCMGIPEGTIFWITQQLYNMDKAISGQVIDKNLILCAHLSFIESYRMVLGRDQRTFDNILDRLKSNKSTRYESIINYIKYRIEIDHPGQNFLTALQIGESHIEYCISKCELFHAAQGFFSIFGGREKFYLLISAVAAIALFAFLDGAPDQPSASVSAVPARTPAASSPTITPAPPPSARQNPTLEGFTVRMEQFGDWNFHERRDSFGNRICLIQSTSTSTPAMPLLGIGWSGRNQSLDLFVNSDSAPISILNISIDNQSFQLRHDHTISLGSDLRRHHYIFPVVMIDAFSSGNVLTANGVRYSLRGSFRAYGALAACINARP